MKKLPLRLRSSRTLGFSLIEVILAIGIFLVTVLALIGLLGPTLQSVDEVEKTDEIASVVNTLNAFLQNSPEINPGGSKFNAIYQAVANDGFATVFFYRWFDESATTGNEPPKVRLEIGFADDEGGEITGADAVVNAGNADFGLAAGPIFRVVLTPSSVMPLQYHVSTTTDSNGDVVPARNSDGVFELADAYDDVSLYEEGYFPMEVRIFAREEDMQAIQGTMPNPTLDDLKDEEPIFTYNTAVVR